ncbi:MAG: hypothetical protein WAO20_06695 [Acidobacteriota bacterium]
MTIQLRVTCIAACRRLYLARDASDQRDTLKRYSGLDAFEQALRSLLTRHRKRRTFIRRLIDAGIWRHGYRIPPPVLPYAPEEEG